MTVGQRIAQRRKELGLSQEGLGERLGVSRQAIYKWESDAALPEIEKLVNLSREFSVSIDWLLGQEDESREPQELTPEQLRMVEEIVGRYLDARSARIPREMEEKPAAGPEDESETGPAGVRWLKKWGLSWLALAAVVVMVMVIFNLFQRLDSVRQDYQIVLNSVMMIRDDVNRQINGISSRVEDILQNQNSLTVEQSAEVISTDYRANTVTIFVQAVPRTYVEGITAEFILTSAEETVTVPGEAGGNHAFTAQITGPLSDDISVSVAFLTGDQQQTQLIKRFSGLYQASFPEVEIADEVMRPVTENGGWFARSKAEVSLSAVNGGEAEVTSIRLGLFRDCELVAWYEETERPSYPTAGPWTFELEEEIALEQGGVYCLAAFLTDEYGRTWVYSNMSFHYDDSASYELYYPYVYSTDPADWSC